MAKEFIFIQRIMIEHKNIGKIGYIMRSVINDGGGNYYGDKIVWSNDFDSNAMINYSEDEK